MEKSTRQKGFNKFSAGMLAWLLAMIAVHWITSHELPLPNLLLILMCVPAAWGLAGLLEIISNRPFSELDQWWMSLKGWQRGVLGIGLCAVLIGAMLAGMALFADAKSATS